MRMLRGLLAAALAALLLAGCTHRNVRSLERFRSLTEAGELDRARAMMSDDPRVWWETREGDGAPWTLGAGRWHAWDTHFRGASTHDRWRTADGGRTVWAVFEEINDYYRLLERPAQHHRQSYFFDDGGLIAGMMVSDEPEPRGTPAGLADDFEAWASLNHPAEWAYLRPGGRIDPTGDRPERTRRLLNEWRSTRGLAEIW